MYPMLTTGWTPSRSTLDDMMDLMSEAVEKLPKFLDAKMWAYSGSEDRPYDIFDFRVSRDRDGPAGFLAG